MKRLLVLALILVLTSCGANKFLTSSVTPSQISNLSYLEPISYIQRIEKGNKSAFSDSLSTLTKTALDSLLQKNSAKFRLSQQLVFPNDTIKNKVEIELSSIAQQVFQKKKLEGIALTPAIDSLIESNGERFALSVVATGFGRRKGNYGGQVAKGAAIGILTLGMYTPVPIKSNLTLYAFIFDAEKNEVAYYKMVPPVEKEPTDPEVIDKQLQELFKGYFYEEK